MPLYPLQATVSAFYLMSGIDIELDEAYLAHPSVSVLLPQQWLMRQNRVQTAYSDPDDVVSRQLIGLYATYQMPFDVVTSISIWHVF